MNAQEQLQQIEESKQRFHEEVERLFPDLQEKLFAVVEDFIQEALASEDNHTFKASMMVAHEAAAMLLGRIEAVPLARGVPESAVENTTRRCLVLGREKPILIMED
jgi:hypothetical protein